MSGLVSRPVRALAILAATLAALIVFATVAEAHTDSAPKVSVRASPGLAEADPAAAVATHRSIVRAAKRVCGAASVARPTLQDRAVTRACIAEAVDSAVVASGYDALRTYYSALDKRQRVTPGGGSARLALAAHALGRTDVAQAEASRPSRLQRIDGIDTLALRFAPIQADDVGAQDDAFRRVSAAAQRVCSAGGGYRSLRLRELERRCFDETMERTLAHPRLAALAGYEQRLALR